MSSSIVTYTSISSDYEEPSNTGSPGVVVYGYDGLPMHPVDPYVEAALQALEQAPPSPDYIPTPEHPPSLDYVPDPEEPEQAPLSLDYLSDDDDDDDDDEHEAFEDDDEEEEEEHLAPADSSVVPAVNPVSSAEDTEAFKTDESAPTPYASAPTPPSPPPSLLFPLSSPLLQIPSPPLPLPSPPTTSPTYAEAPLGYRRAHFTALTSRFEAGESLSPDAARHAGQTLAHRVDYGFVNTVDTSIRASESRAMTAIGEVNERVTDLDATQRQDAQELYAWSHSESRIQVMEAHIRALQRDVDVLQRQRIRDEDRLTAHNQHEHDKFRDLVRAAEARPHDGPEDVGVDDALTERDADKSRNGDDSHDSGSGGRRRMPIARECTYSDSTLEFQGRMSNQVFYLYSPGKCFNVVELPREIKKLEIELWNLKVKGTDVKSYSQCFQELALMCSRMFLEESNEVKKYVGGLPDMIQGSVMASKPKKMQDAIEFATKLMDQKICTLAERQAENKRKFEDTLRNNQNQQQPFKRHNVARAYTAGPGEKKSYLNLYALNATTIMMDSVLLRTNPNSNVVTGTFLQNNRYALILFDTGVDRSFVSTAFSSLIDIIPTTLDHGYDVKLADGRIIWVNTLIRGCTLNFLNHPFNIDLMLVEMGSFDVIIGMEWLSKYHFVIVCDKKIVRIPFRNKILIVRGDGSSNEHGS
ncbi:putative reverse transcriptase domain-containing protein [Tanacetum coccineum]